MFTLRCAVFPGEADAVRELFRDYQRDIGVDLCFQSFEQELATLPGRYRVVWMAVVDGQVAGCAALRDYAEGVAELKRVFVYPKFRGLGIGKALTVHAIEAAREWGYGTLRLDTIPEKMPSADRLYRSLGFEVVPGTDKATGTRHGIVDYELRLADALAQSDEEQQTGG
jgi:GNAT superfamily N-acetyltransferase